MNAVSLAPPKQRLYEFNCQHHEPATRNTEPRHVPGILSLCVRRRGHARFIREKELAAPSILFELIGDFQDRTVTRET